MKSRGVIFLCFLVFFLSGGGLNINRIFAAPVAAPVAVPAPAPVVAPVPVPAATQATAVPPELAQDKFFYDPTLGRDPFRIPLINTVKLKGADPVINEDSLEGALIPEGVRVLAIIYDSKRPRALVEKLSNKKSYLVFNKSRLGIGGGIVSEIREDEIVVVRSVENEGQSSVENIVLRLNEKVKKNLQKTSKEQQEQTEQDVRR